LGDLGIFAGKIKCKNIRETYNWFKSNQQHVAGNIELVDNKKHFFLYDPYGNIFDVVESGSIFRDEKKYTGGAYGAIIGCSDIEKSKQFYATILGYDTVIYDKTGKFSDLQVLPGGSNEFRRVLLTHSEPRKGPFSAIFGESELELVQVIDRQPRKIFENRYWGELGFIHLCFDIQGMDALREKCKQNGCPFTVDTGEIFKNGSFDMGDAAGLFAYNEDPDGALIEYVETHKLPVLKSLGISINLQKRDPSKSLPHWLLSALRFLKAKDIG
jgi:catechol 2,3-dioxygenase-like lactoylglutathione lyase family enzyme